uniref:Fe2OG dioxygenase domain-containing protein n=1 Tax=Chromera velia CCMP2878 TaxID=1169474 RepID=A0A0G4HRF1_9ALVE|eukprot:Cvel_30611.t1-p1 / transcript=Cvel_30611.t1 / gene=Cvel_30611 / organism=Chromera_velia_CCMP2878 / gene_product=hypothetical protein / transcript_product=hypothetical protein / location=Cvel_scaffold4392:6753-7856(+) / protein_length=327 / sequence_SO=supercontig / SO=protein_coding / is_pseudo=false
MTDQAETRQAGETCPKLVPDLPEVTPEMVNFVSNPSPPVVEEIEAGSVFLVHNLLSKEECASLIAACKEMNLAKTGSRKYRDCKRLVAKATAVSEILFNRIRHLPLFSPLEVDPSDRTFHQPLFEGVAGRWTALGLNDVLRVCLYDPEGHFSPHFDGEFRRSDTERSLRTFMLYLNDVDDTEGGATKFLSTATGDEDDLELTFNPSEDRYQAAPSATVRFSVPPRAGTAIIFNHRMLHEGAVLRSGEKWILRSDIMYRQTSRHAAVEMTHSEKKALETVRAAQKLEEDASSLPAGHPDRQRLADEAVSLYMRVRRISSKVAAAFRLD